MPRIAVLQHAMSASVDANLDTALRLMDEAARDGAALAVFPEVQLSPFFPARRNADAEPYAMTLEHPALRAIARRAGELGLVTVANIYLEDDGIRYDASPVFDADGTCLGVSRMVHVAQFESFWEKDYYAAGSGFEVYDTSIGKVGVVICYDRHFPESYRACALQGAEIIATPSCNLADEPLDLFAWEIRSLAFQNSVFAAMANRCGTEDGTRYGGHSVIAGPDGALLGMAQGEEAVLIADADLDARRKIAAKRGWLDELKPWLRPGLKAP